MLENSSNRRFYTFKHTKEVICVVYFIFDLQNTFTHLKTPENVESFCKTVLTLVNGTRITVLVAPRQILEKLKLSESFCNFATVGGSNAVLEVILEIYAVNCPVGQPFGTLD